MGALGDLSRENIIPPEHGLMGRVVTRETTLQDEVSRIEAESGLLERIWKYELYAGGALVVAGVGAGFLLDAWWVLILGAVLVMVGAGHAMKRKENVKSVGMFKGGARGEQEVSNILERQLPDSYLILNDVTVRSGTKKAQNDHLVLGPNGIFVIETKAYAGRLVGDAKDDQLMQHKEFKGKKTSNRIKNPIPQNEYHLRIVAESMKDAGYVTDDLVSVIVFTNKWSRLEISNAEVPVIKPFALIQTIMNHKSNYTYDEPWLTSLAKVLAPQAEI